MSDVREATRLTVRLNTDFAWEIQGRTVDTFGNESPATGFEPTDAIEVKVWGGADAATVFNPTAEWIDAPTALVRLDVTAAMTAALTPGTYPLEMTVIVNGTGERRPFLEAEFQVTEAPGLATAPPVYCSVADMLDIAGSWLPQLRQERGLANFARQRGNARNWIDRIIIGAYRPRFSRRRDLLFNSSLMLGPLETPDPTIEGYLADNRLMVDPILKELTAHKAIAYVCDSQVSFTADDPYPARARYHHAFAGSLVCQYRPRLDTNGDGQADMAFNLGVLSFR